MRFLGRIFLAASFAVLAVSGARADIVIAVAGPMSGSDAAVGEQMRRGAEMVVADINAKGGVAGQKLKLIVRNRDATMSEFESSDFHREKVVAPGGEISVFVGPLDAGSYEFFDDFHPEDRGHLVVK